MTDTPKVPDTETPDVGEIVEVIFEDHYTLAIAAFIAGALIVAAVVYWMGTRSVEQSEDTPNAAD